MEIDIGFGYNYELFYCSKENTNATNDSETSNVLSHIFSFSTIETDVKCEVGIGHSSTKFTPIFFLLLASGGFILNLIIIIRNFTQKRNANGSRKESSMKRLFAIIPFLDCLTSVYWIISSIIFKSANLIEIHAPYCLILSILYLSIFTFEFIFINFVLIHFRKISLNPIEGILKPERHIAFYILVSVGVGLLMSFLAFSLGIMGRSPMITCFLNTEQTYNYGLIFLIPVCSIISIVCQVIYDLKFREMFTTDKEVREVYKMNSTYVLVFSLLHVPMLVLIILTSFKDTIIGQHETFLKVYTYFSTLTTCSIPLIIGIIRLGKGFTKLKKIKELQRRFTRSATINKNKNAARKSFSKQLNESLASVDQFDWLETHAMEFFMRDILIGVATCIYNSKVHLQNEYFGEKDNEEITKYNINFENFSLNDETVKNSQYLDVNIIEYAPKYFSFLRKLEKIDLDEMVNSFLPKNNKKGISKSQGKSGSFFISTDDNHYMIKTLRSDEFELIRHTFLKEYVEHLNRNPNSLLSRIYGMYSVIMSQGQEILIIMMRNVIGDFKDNIIAKYDLKGSTQNRKLQFDSTKTDESTMKDLNFNEIEYGIMMSKSHIKRLRKEAKSDSEFLRKLELMDYSLFLVKLTLSKKEAEEIFGKSIVQKQEEAFSEYMKDDNNNEEEINENLNLNDLPRATINEGGQNFDIKHYKQYLFPSLTTGTAYLLSIIDYFQMFNFYKYVESGIKTKITKEGKDAVSCVDPDTYSKRFIKYVNKMTDIQGILRTGSEMSGSDGSFERTGSTSQDEIQVKEKNNDTNVSKELSEDVGAAIEMSEMNTPS